MPGAATLRSRGDLDGALQRIQAALDIERKLLGASHDEYAESLQTYGEIQLERNDLAAAVPALTEAVAVLRAKQAPNHYETAEARMANALLLMRTERSVEAETEIRAAISVYLKVFPPGHRLLVAARSALGESLLLQGKLDDAEPLLVSSAQQFGDSVHYERRLALRRLIRLYELKGSAATARQFENELLALEQTARSR